jgi:LPPG:FO 2-phospho-L-lactate transferase
MMRTLGHEPSPVGVADIYDGLIDAMVIDQIDAELATDLERRGLSVHATDTIMRDAKARQHLANVALEVAGIRVGK